MEREIGDYELLEELGRGGMGVVYRARHRELGREVALKLLLERDDELVARFVREGRSAAALLHPNLVRVYAAGVAAGRPYLAFELVEGRSLSDRLKNEGALPVAEAVRLSTEVAEALAHAHGQGIVHRDVKPANVLVDASGRARLTDFGIAKRLHAQEQRLTQTGTILGTPAFAPPEVLDGRPGEVGPAVDVYGLGATLYALIAGRAPFEGAGVLQVMAAAMSEQAPSLRGRPGVSPQLAELVARCLSKRPSQRPPDAAALVEELRALPLERSRRALFLPLLLVGGASLSAALVLALGRGAGPTSAGPSPAMSPAPSARVSPASPSPLTATPAPYPSAAAGGGDPSRDFSDYGWRVSSWSGDTGPARRELHAATFDGERVLIQGGRDGLRTHSDLWTWTGRWQMIVPGLIGPEPRYGHSIVWDARREALLLLGGKLSATSRVHYEDLWEWQEASGWREVDPTGVWPSGRAFAGVAYDAQRGRVLLWGGIQTGGGRAAGKRTDLWARTQRGQWEVLADGAEVPQRQSPALACDGSRVWLYGGHLSTDALGDWWTLALGETSWQQVERERAPPPTAWAQLVEIGGGRLLLYDQREALLWLWAERAWWRLPRGETFPARRRYATFTWDAKRKVGVLVGGRTRGMDRPVSEVWEFGEW